MFEKPLGWLVFAISITAQPLPVLWDWLGYCFGSKPDERA
jgi:hypothetical protein